MFAACARFDTAVEINCRPERQDPPDELLELALEWECKISIDTDAHAPGQLEWQLYGCEKAARHEIDIDQIVNTWAADDLLEWAGLASHHLTCPCLGPGEGGRVALLPYVEEDHEAQDQRPPQAGQPRQQAQRRPLTSADGPTVPGLRRRPRRRRTTRRRVCTASRSHDPLPRGSSDERRSRPPWPGSRSRTCAPDRSSIRNLPGPVGAARPR